MELAGMLIRRERLRRSFSPRRIINICKGTYAGESSPACAGVLAQSVRQRCAYEQPL